MTLWLETGNMQTARGLSFLNIPFSICPPTFNLRLSLCPHARSSFQGGSSIAKGSHQLSRGLINGLCREARRCAQKVAFSLFFDLVFSQTFDGLPPALSSFFLLLTSTLSPLASSWERRKGGFCSSFLLQLLFGGLLLEGMFQRHWLA